MCVFSEVSKLGHVRSGNYCQDALLLSGGRGKSLLGGVHSGEVPLLSHLTASGPRSFAIGVQTFRNGSYSCPMYADR